jgi:hypothetical protein
MTTLLRTRVWPWFVLAAVLLFVGAVILRGTPQALVNSAAALTFLGGCIRKVGLSIRDNEVGAEMVGRRGGGAAGYAGWIAEGPEERRKTRPPDR